MAIAYDNASFQTFTDHSGSTDTVSHTTGNGSDRLLVVTASAYGSTPVTVSGITYNGVSMTLIGTKLESTNFRTTMYYLLAPSTGTNNVVVTYTTGDYNTRTCVSVASYTGVEQSGQPDGSVTASSASTSSFTTTSTVTDSGCWLILGAIGLRNNLAGGTGTTRRTNPADTVCAWIFDSNGTVGTGSQSLIVTQSAAGQMATVMASFSPSAGGASTFIPRISFIM